MTALTVGVPVVGDHETAARLLRVRLCERRGLHEPPAARPHVSLLVLLDAPVPESVDAVLARVAARSKAFSVRARGYGVFVDQQSGIVLYTPVVRTEALSRLHAELFHALRSEGVRIDGHYHPDTWFPHVTLWPLSMTPLALGEAMECVASGPAISWTLPVDSIGRFGPEEHPPVFHLGTFKPA